MKQTNKIRLQDIGTFLVILIMVSVMYVNC